MAEKKSDKNDVPAIPVPPAASVPPIETPPAVPPAPPAPPAPAAAPAASATLAPPAPPHAQPVANPYGAPAAYAGAPAGPSQGLSITSMVLGILGILSSFIGVGFLPALAAVITGHLAQKQQPHAKPFWLTGIITGYIGIAISVISVILLIVVFAGIWAACGTARVC
ncbi:MAG: DUF4190 domain-containing protein [Rhodoglobus sp.]